MPNISDNQPGQASILEISMRRLITSAEKIINYSLLAGHDIDIYIAKLLSRAEIITWIKDGEIKAFIAYYCNDPEKYSTFISMIIVEHACRGQGIASSLIEAVITISRARSFRVCGLKVHQSNHKAVQLYTALGFNLVDNSNEYTLMEKAL
jgi:GNAT superfamily N-acetyltransferase